MGCVLSVVIKLHIKISPGYEKILNVKMMEMLRTFKITNLKQKRAKQTDEKI